MAHVVSCPHMVRRIVVVLLGAIVATACGGLPELPIGFVNETHHTDARLWALWKTARQNLSQQIDLNPLEQVVQNATPAIRAGDPRVWNVLPRQLVVGAQTDISSAVFYTATGDLRPDPTGLIACPQPCNVPYAAAYSLFQKPITRYAASWEHSKVTSILCSPTSLRIRYWTRWGMT